MASVSCERHPSLAFWRGILFNGLPYSRAALVMWGVGLFWLTNAVMTIGDLVLRGKIPFNMGFWVRCNLNPASSSHSITCFQGFTFPIGVFATATNSLGIALGSKAFRIVGTIISVSEVLLWLFVASKTAWLAWEGSLFASHPPSLPLSHNLSDGVNDFL